MDVRAHGIQPGRFSERMFRLLDRVEFRCANADDDNEEVRRLRYQNDGHGPIGPRTDDALGEIAYTAKTLVTTTRIDGEFAIGMRIDVARCEDDTLPALALFGDVITPYLRKGRTVLELGQSAVGFGIFKGLPEWPVVSLRPVWLAAEYFDVDFVIATISVVHQAFYRHMFAFRQWCEPRQSPNSDRAIACIGLDFRINREQLEARYPFLRSTVAERDCLFSRLPPKTSKCASSGYFRRDC